MSGRWPLLLGALWLAIAAVRPGASSQELPTAPPPRVLPPAELLRKLELQGAGSCAAAACHNGPGLGVQGREYAVALERDTRDPRQRVKDRHAQAYDVLFDPLARKIESVLHPGAAPRPETDALCLRCHVAGVFDNPVRLRDGVPQFRLEDGVSCEACHGPAQRWLASHFRTAGTAGWPAPGQSDTRSLPGRIRLCVDCHVGGAGTDVNHDLIAAGHPRLSFEFASFHSLLHKHWDYAKDHDPAADPRARRDFEARAWMLGQLISARAALALLADRAEPGASRPWPEFAEYNCASCHHQIQLPASRYFGSPLARAAGSPGILIASDWYTSLLPEACAGLNIPYDGPVHDALAAVRKAMATNRPDRREVAQTARRAVAILDQRLAAAQDGPAAPVPVDALLGRIARNARKRATHSYDETAQIYIAIHALRRARTDLGMPLAPLELPPLRGLLQFPPPVEGSAALTPNALRATLDAISRMEPR